MFARIDKAISLIRSDSFFDPPTFIDAIAQMTLIDLLRISERLFDEARNARPNSSNVATHGGLESSDRHGGIIWKQQSKEVCGYLSTNWRKSEEPFPRAKQDRAAEKDFRHVANSGKID